MKRYQGREIDRKNGELLEEMRRYHHTNEFTHRVSEAMGLDWISGKKVCRAILRNIVKRTTRETGESLITELPLGYKIECSLFLGPPLKSVNAEKIERDVQRASGDPNTDPERLVRLFWLYMEGFFRESDAHDKGTLAKVLNELPSDIKKLLSGNNQVS